MAYDPYLQLNEALAKRQAVLEHNATRAAADYPSWLLEWGKRDDALLTALMAANINGLLPLHAAEMSAEQLRSLAKWRYGCINRPAIEAAPAGWKPDEAQRGFLPYGTIYYRQPLTERQVYDYELALLSPMPHLPLFQDGEQVKLFRTGRIVTVEINEKYGDMFAGDDRLPFPTDADMSGVEMWRIVRRWFMYGPVETVETVGNKS